MAPRNGRLRHTEVPVRSDASARFSLKRIKKAHCLKAWAFFLVYNIQKTYGAWNGIYLSLPFCVHLSSHSPRTRAFVCRKGSRGKGIRVFNRVPAEPEDSHFLQAQGNRVYLEAAAIGRVCRVLKRGRRGRLRISRAS